VFAATFSYHKNLHSPPNPNLMYNTLEADNSIGFCEIRELARYGF
jgi:hypothetical protein